MKITILLLIFIIQQISIFHANNITERAKRYVPIYWPYGGSFKLVFGITIPVKLPSRQSLGWALNFQFQYPQVTNLTQIKGGLPPTLVRKSRSNEENEREILYEALESLMNKYGFNGKACLLRNICENASSSVHNEENGLYGQIIDIILGPDDTETGLSGEYIDARDAGRFGANCYSLYPDCPNGHGLLDSFSYIV